MDFGNKFEGELTKKTQLVAMTTAEFTCDFTLADTDWHAALRLFLLRWNPSFRS